jgi:hypothetical protein
MADRQALHGRQSLKGNVRLIRFGGHLPKGGYDVPDAKQIQWSASPPAVL